MCGRAILRPFDKMIEDDAKRTGNAPLCVDVMPHLKCCGSPPLACRAMAFFYEVLGTGVGGMSAHGQRCFVVLLCCPQAEPVDPGERPARG